MIKKSVEKRSYPRLNGYFLVKYKVITPHPENIPLTIASTKDISGGGVRLRLKDYVPVGSLIEVFINYPGFDAPIQILARLVWIRKIRNFDMYDSGVQFLNVDEAMTRTIAKKVEEVLYRMAGKSPR